IDTGTIALTNTSNSYFGGTQVNPGATLEWSNDSELGSVFSVIGLQNATLDILNPISSSRSIFLGLANTINTNANAVTLSGNIFLTGGFTKLGTSTLTLSGNNSFTGAMTISAGTLEFANAGSYPASNTANVFNNAALLFTNPSGVATVQSSISGTGTLT